MLRARDIEIDLGKVFERKPSYYFMDSLFMQMAQQQDYRRENEAVKSFYVQWGSCVAGPPINKVDFIFLPTCVNGNHWVLYVFAVKAWSIMLLDPLYDDAQYPAEEKIYVRFLLRVTCSLLIILVACFS